MSEIKISVIIPIYNVEEFLEDTLDSILNQTMIDEIEVLMINDGSSDNSRKIIENYAEKYDNFHAYTKKNEGQGITRNYGLNKAQGEYIHFMDSDDYIPPNTYELLYNNAMQNNNDIIIGNVLRFSRWFIFESKLFRHAFKDLDRNVKSTRLDDFNQIIWDTAIWNKLYKRDFLVENNIQFIDDKVYYEDLLFALESYIKAESIGIVKDIIYYWRFRNTYNSVTQSVSQLKNFEDRLFILKLSQNLLQSNHVSPEVCNAIHYKWLSHDLILHFSIFNRYPEDSYAELLDKTNSILDFIPDDVFKELNPFKQQLYSSVKNNDIDTLNQLVDDHYSKGNNLSGENTFLNLELEDLVFEVKSITNDEDNLFLEFGEKQKSFYNFKSHNFNAVIVDEDFHEFQPDLENNIISIPIKLIENKKFLKVKLSYSDDEISYESFLTNTSRTTVEFGEFHVDIGSTFNKQVQIDCFKKADNSILISNVQLKNQNFMLTGKAEKNIQNLMITNLVTFEKRYYPISLKSNNEFELTIPCRDINHNLMKKWELNCEEAYNAIKASRTFEFEHKHSKTVFLNGRSKILILNDAYKKRNKFVSKFKKVVRGFKKKI